MGALIWCLGPALTGLAKRRWHVPGPVVARVAVGVTCMMTVSLAQAQPPAAPLAAEAAQRQALVAQKLSLAEQLLGSARTRQIETQAGPDAQAKLKRARDLLAQARQADNLRQVEARLDESLLLTAQALRDRSGGGLPEHAQRQRNAELLEQVKAYRGAMLATLQARKSEPEAQTQATLDGHVREAERLGALGHHADAGKALERAYRVAVESVSALRAGETVTIALKFDTPADEYAYEVKRHESYEMLVKLALAERRPEAQALAAIESQRQQAQVCAERATVVATAGDHRAAVRELEEATRHLVRVLQLAGVAGIY